MSGKVTARASGTNAHDNLLAPIAIDIGQNDLLDDPISFMDYASDKEPRVITWLRIHCRLEPHGETAGGAGLEIPLGYDCCLSRRKFQLLDKPVCIHASAEIRRHEGTADVMLHRGTLKEGMPFLPKPFSRDDLARQVRAVLDGQ